jgi:hypothetical protein
MNKRVLNGINSKAYKSMEAQTDLRMKPNHQVEKTKKMTEYYK